MAPRSVAESQPEHCPAIQDFLKWNCDENIQKKGCTGSGNEVGAPYISCLALKEKLTRERIELLLKELFQDWDQPVPNADRVRKYYLRPFAILLSAGHGRMIHRIVEYYDLQDHFLPFSVAPINFPKSTTCNLFELFYKEQWQYCAVKLEYDMSYKLENDSILPILDKTRIGAGGSAILYKITVDEVYNNLLPGENSDVVILPIHHRLTCFTNQTRSQRHLQPPTPLL